MKLLVSVFLFVFLKPNFSCGLIKQMIGLRAAETLQSLFVGLWLSFKVITQKLLVLFFLCSFNEENHNCYSYTLMFINCVLATQSKRVLSKDEFTQTFVLPRVKRACKYSMLCREISQNHFYIVDSPRRKSLEGQSDEEENRSNTS